MEDDWEERGEFRIAVADYVLGCWPDGLPDTFDSLAEHATLVECFELERRSRCCVTVAHAAGAWPFLVVAQSYAPAGMGFSPGVLLAPEERRLFVGAGERLLAYDLDPPGRLWVDSADTGFWGWARHGDVVLMSAELELAAWTVTGDKLWTTFVEPPWSYRVEANETVRLDVMGNERVFSLRGGPR